MGGNNLLLTLHSVSRGCYGNRWASAGVEKLNGTAEWSDEFSRRKKGRAQILQQCCEMSHQLSRRWVRASTCIYKLLKSDFGDYIWSRKSDRTFGSSKLDCVVCRWFGFSFSPHLESAPSCGCKGGVCCPECFLSGVLNDVPASGHCQEKAVNDFCPLPF